MKVRSVNIAGFQFLPALSNHVLVEEADLSYYHPFLNRTSEEAETIPISIRQGFSSIAGTNGFQKLFATDRTWSIYRNSSQYMIRFQPPVFDEPLWVARFNRDFSDVTVYCGEKLVTSRNGLTTIANPIRYPLDQLLLMYLLAKNRGAIVHAAGINIHGKAYLFAGRSGAGKSTLSKQFAHDQGFEQLSDDRIAIRQFGSEFRAYGTPWPGENRIASNQSLPLGGIFFLQKGSANKARELTPREALERLLPVTSIPWFDKEVLPNVLDFCGTLMAGVPNYELHFKPDPEIVGFLREFVST